MGRSFSIIVNPAAGRGRTVRLLPRLVEKLEGWNLDAEVVVSTDPEDPPTLARDAFERDRIVVACGGDGLVGQLAAVAAAADGTLAIVPSGSGNDFARLAGYDHRSPIDAVRALASGSIVTVDLGAVNGRPFCCVAATGFDAEANRWANDVRWLTGTPLYIAAMLRTLATYHPRRFRLTVDGERRDVEAWLLAVGNAPSYGGGMRIAPDARVDDGLLNGTIVGPVSRVEFLRAFPKVFNGRHVEHPMVETFTGREVIVEPADPGLHVFADGEDHGKLPATVTSRPQALRLVVPADSSLVGP